MISELLLNLKNKLIYVNYDDFIMNDQKGAKIDSLYEDTTSLVL